MQYATFPAFTAAANTGSGTIHSAAFLARTWFGATCQVNFTSGVAAGTLFLEGSNDTPSVGQTPNNWSAIPNATVTVAAGAPSCIPNTDALLCYEWIRVSWTSTGGAGTLNAKVHVIG